MLSSGERETRDRLASAKQCAADYSTWQTVRHLTAWKQRSNLRQCQRCTQTQRSSANRRARSNFYLTQSLQCTELTTETSSSS